MFRVRRVGAQGLPRALLRGPGEAPRGLRAVCGACACALVAHPPFPSLVAQAHDINALFGFRLECLERLGDEQGVFVWRRINELFNYLPLAASIEGKILCMHGGIGR